jgi:hypothetical protein
MHKKKKLLRESMNTLVVILKKLRRKRNLSEIREIIL